MRRRKARGEIAGFEIRMRTVYAVFENGERRSFGVIGGEVATPEQAAEAEETITMACGTFGFRMEKWAAFPAAELARQDALIEMSNNERRRKGLPMLRRIKRRRKR